MAHLGRADQDRTCPLMGPKQTHSARLGKAGIDPGCVKTPQARERLELFSQIDPKSIAHRNLRNEIRNRKDDPFYQISTPPRFYTAKTQNRHAGTVARLARGRTIAPWSSSMRF